MSRWMQIRVRVDPVYKKSFAKDFPKLYRVVTGLDNSLIDQNPTFMDLVPLVVRLSHEKTMEPGLSSAAGSWARPRSCSTSWRTTSRPLRRSWAEAAAPFPLTFPPKACRVAKCRSGADPSSRPGTEGPVKKGSL
jgi:hypothetical protein